MVDHVERRNFCGMFCSTIGMRSSRCCRSSSSTSRSCFLKCAMSSGCVRSSSFVSIATDPHQNERPPTSTPDPSEPTLEQNGRRKRTLVMKLLKMMNLILVLVIAMMSRTQLHAPVSFIHQNLLSIPVLSALSPNPPTPQTPTKRNIRTPESGNLFPRPQALNHSPLDTTPSPFSSNKSSTSRTTRAFRSSPTSRRLSSSSPYVRRISSAVSVPELSKSCSAKKEPAS